MIIVKYFGAEDTPEDQLQSINLGADTLWNKQLFQDQFFSGYYVKPYDFLFRNRVPLLKGNFEIMFFLKYSGKYLFLRLKDEKFYRLPWKKEQLPGGEYQRPLAFFFRNRAQIIKEQVELTGIRPSMNVKFTGTVPAVRIGGVIFKKGIWTAVPIDFNACDEDGQDQFLSLGFKFSMEGSTVSMLEDYNDGGRILVLRKLGGLGDILMQSQIFPEIRKRYPKSEINFAIPKVYHSIFDGCRDIDRIIDKADIESRLYKIVAAAEFDFISDITSSCVVGEHEDLKSQGFISRSRQEIWAESMGLFDGEYKETSIVIPESEVLQARKKYFPEVSKPIVCVSPISAERTRAYPIAHTLNLISKLERDYHVVYMDSETHKYIPCQQIVAPDFREMGAIIKNLACVISVDTGPLHYAGIFGIPVIGIFGVTDHYPRLKHYIGYGFQGKCEKGDPPCWYSMTGCGRIKSGDMRIATCMDIPADAVYEKTKEILSGKRLQGIS